MTESVYIRGQIYHVEMNLPVYTALQNLSHVVTEYGTALRHRGVINQNSTIRTLTVGSDIAYAQSAWAQNVNYPGKRKD